MTATGTSGTRASLAGALVAALLLAACGSGGGDSDGEGTASAETAEETTVDLSEARASCRSGVMAACDELYEGSVDGSRGQEFGSTCGGRSEPTRGACDDGPDREGSDIPEGERPGDLGSDPALDRLAASCHEGDMMACDDLYLESDEGSAYEAYGSSCGERVETDLYCQPEYGYYTTSELRLLDAIPGDRTDANSIAGTCRTSDNHSSDEVATLRCLTNEEEVAVYSVFTSVAALEREYDQSLEERGVARGVGAEPQCPAEFPFERSGVDGTVGRFSCSFTDTGTMTVHTSTCGEPILTVFERDDQLAGEAYTFWREEGGPLCG